MVLYGAVNMTLGTELREWPDVKISSDVEIFLQPYLLQAYGLDYELLEGEELDELDLYLEAPVTALRKTAGVVRFTKFKHAPAWTEASAFLEGESIAAFLWAPFERVAKTVSRRGNCLSSPGRKTTVVVFRYRN